MSKSETSGHAAARLMTLATLGVFRFFVVDQGSVQTVMSFGRMKRIASPGLHRLFSVWGLLQSPGDVISTAEQIEEYPDEMVFTSDGVKCLIDLMVCYRIASPEKALFEVSNFRVAIRNLVQSVLRNECGKLPARSMLSAREQMAASIQNSLERDCEPWGIKLRLVEIKNIEMAIQERKS